MDCSWNCDVVEFPSGSVTSDDQRPAAGPRLSNFTVDCTCSTAALWLLIKWHTAAIDISNTFKYKQLCIFVAGIDGIANSANSNATTSMGLRLSNMLWLVDGDLN
jgi:hypothetical protein